MEDKNQIINKILKAANDRPKEWRYGQAVFNYAYEFFPDIVNQLRGTYYDCYYINEKVDIFLKELIKNIDKYGMH